MCVPAFLNLKGVLDMVRTFGRTDPRSQWGDSLPDDVWNRLCHCRSRKEDVLPLAQAKWQYIKNKNREYTKEDALVCVIEHLDCNGQDFELTREEWNDILACIH